MQRHSTRNLPNPASRESNLNSPETVASVFPSFIKSVCWDHISTRVTQLGHLPTHLSCPYLKYLLSWFTNNSIYSLYMLSFYREARNEQLTRNWPESARRRRGKHVNTEGVQHRFTVQGSSELLTGQKDAPHCTDRSVPLASTSHVLLGIPKDCRELSNRRTLLIYIC